MKENSLKICTSTLDFFLKIKKNYTYILFILATRFINLEDLVYS